MANGNHLSDIALELIPGHDQLRPEYRPALRKRPVPQSKSGIGRFQDWALAEGEANLGQAITIRLLTPRGELAALGHADYGSRLHELVGRTNTATTHNLIKLYILESLARESRIAKVEDIQVRPDPYLRTLVKVTLTVLPASMPDPVTVGPITIRLES